MELIRLGAVFVIILMTAACSVTGINANHFPSNAASLDHLPKHIAGFDFARREVFREKARGQFIVYTQGPTVAEVSIYPIPNKDKQLSQASRLHKQASHVAMNMVNARKRNLYREFKLLGRETYAGRNGDALLLQAQYKQNNVQLYSSAYCFALEDAYIKVRISSTQRLDDSVKKRWNGFSEQVVDRIEVQFKSAAQMPENTNHTVEIASLQ